MEKLEYRQEDKFAPIPPQEVNLPSVEAERFYTFDFKTDDNVVEGLEFDHHDNLYVCNCPQSDVYRISIKDKKLTKVLHLADGLIPSSVKIHADGRIFIPAYTIGDNRRALVIIADPKDGHIIKTTANMYNHVFDDLTIDKKGGFYLSDFIGTFSDLKSRVLYVEPDEKTIRPLFDGGVMLTNGIELDPEEKSLWVTEYGKGRLLHYRLPSDKPTLFPYFNIPYYFTGLRVLIQLPLIVMVMFTSR